MIDKQKCARVGVSLPRIWIPTDTGSLDTWCTIACDQYTSDPGYWARVEEACKDKPSTLHMILPEVYLGTEEQAGRTQAAYETMEAYLQNGVIRELEPGFILVERSFANGKPTRTGLLMALDLEQYDFSPDSESLIRATEGTIQDRIPPRLAIRSRATLELPHVMVLIDDPGRTVIEPLKEKELPTLYDGKLGFGMGAIRGKQVTGQAAQGVIDALNALLDTLGETPMLYAMGDGNHSFATAWAHWQNVKQTVPEAEWESHPARYSLCEVVNVHDAGIAFEAIHRAVFVEDGEKALRLLVDGLNEMGMQAELVPEIDLEKQCFGFVTGGRSGVIAVSNPRAKVAAGTADDGIACVLKAMDGKVDYIHGEQEVTELGFAGNLALILPAIRKEELFPAVAQGGPLPRKTFSMGEADEKRCYLEARKITR